MPVLPCWNVLNTYFVGRSFRYWLTDECRILDDYDDCYDVDGCWLWLLAAGFSLFGRLLMLFILLLLFLSYCNVLTSLCVGKSEIRKERENELKHTWLFLSLLSRFHSFRAFIVSELKASKVLSLLLLMLAIKSFYV